MATRLDISEALRPAWEIFAQSAEAVVPPVQMSGTACAERYITTAGVPFSFERTPYIRKPLDRLCSGRFSRVVLMGPAQCGKSQIADLWLAHSAIVSPMNTLWLQVDKALMHDYVVARINPMIRDSPELSKRLMPTPSANNITSKEFRNMMVWFVHPVAGQFRMRTAGRWIADDFDDIPDDIGGQGDPVTLLEGRQTSLEGKGVGCIISSPSTSPKKGVEAQFRLGTQQVLWWPCPHCGQYFEASFTKYASFDRTGTPEDAARSVVLSCPHCGTDIEPKYKNSMRARGEWVGPHQQVTTDGVVVGPEIDTRIDSYRFDGAIGFALWSDLAAKWRAAELALEHRQDEGPLRAFFNTQIGLNYASVAVDDLPIDAGALEKRRETYRLGTVPAGVKVLTAAVDTQKDRWEVMVAGWGEGLECWIIDRFAIRQLGDGRTDIEPATHPEHWSEILRLVFWRRYPLAANPASTMPILNVAIDINGTDGKKAFDAAGYKFWHTARRSNIADQRITLLRGGGNPKGPKLPEPSYVEHKDKGGAEKSGVKFWVPNVNAYKSTIDLRLRRAQPGPGYIHFPEDLDAKYFAELTSEERDDRGIWVKRSDAPHNETLDLMGYNMVALERPPGAGERFDMGWVPTWARPSKAAASDAKPAAAVAAKPAPAPERQAAPSRNRPPPPPRRKGGFVNGWR